MRGTLSSRNARTSSVLRALALGAAVVFSPAIDSAGAQAITATAATSQVGDMDTRWVPWLGCWQLIEEAVRDGLAAGASADNPGEVPEFVPLKIAGDLRVCVIPVESTLGVKMNTLAGEQIALEQTIVADGTQRPLTERDCRGWQRTEWSRNGQRLFARAELSCGSQPLRRVSGLSLMTTGANWVDVQAVEIEGRETVRVRRYRRASDQTPIAGVLTPDVLARAASSAQLAGGMRITIEDVIEANAKVASQAVEAALVETRARFALNRDALIKLDEAGVGDSVIDLMVALSFPERFVVERARGDSFGSSSAFSSSFGSLGPWPDAGFSFYDYPYYYSPFGYSSWGRYYDVGYGPFYTFTPGGFVVLPGGGAGSAQPATTEGRVVNGLGYTRVRPREASSEPPSPGRAGTTSGGFVSRGSSSDSSGSSSSGSSSSGSSSSGSSSGGASVSPQGASSGGSGGDTGRTAQPR